MMSYFVMFVSITLDHIRIPYVTNTKIYVGVAINIDFFRFSAKLQKLLFIFLAVKTYYKAVVVSFLDIL